MRLRTVLIFMRTVLPDSGPPILETGQFGARAGRWKKSRSGVRRAPFGEGEGAAASYEGGGITCGRHGVMRQRNSDETALPAGRLLLALVAPQRRRLLSALAAAVAAAVVELVPYALLARSLDLVLDLTRTGQADGRALAGMAGLVAAALAGKYLLYSFAYYFSHVAAYRLLADIRQDLVRRLAVAPLDWLQRTGSGPLTKAILQDVERLEQFIAHHSVECLAAVVSPLAVAAVLAWIDGRLALAALAVAPLAAVAQGVLLRGLGPRIDAVNRAAGALHGACVEFVRNAPVMKTFCQSARSFRMMRRLLARHGDLVAGVTRRVVPAWAAFTTLLGAGLGVLLPAGLWLLERGMVTPGEVLLAVMLGGGMLRPLLKVAQVSSQIREILAGVRRLAPLLALPARRSGEPGRVPAAAEVRFDRVSVALGGRPVLREVAFTLRPGMMTALVGPSGAGKSTIAHLLGGLLPPDGGEISLGGVPLAALDDAVRAGWIAVAAQDAFLFRGPLLDSLRLGRPDAGPEAVAAALRIAQAAEAVAALGGGPDAPVGERGSRLSGGERQRIAVARALLSDAPVLVLDEATAFADGRTERRFYEALRQTYPDKTLLVIAHRLTAVRDADHIVVLEDGRVIAEGDHESLLAGCPRYAALWHRQFDGEAWTLRTEEAADAGHR